MLSMINSLFARAFLHAPADGPAGALGAGVVDRAALRDGAVAAHMMDAGVAPSFASLSALAADTVATPGAPAGARVRIDEHSPGAGAPALLEAVPGGSPHVVCASAEGAVSWRVAGAEADVRMWGALGDGVADDRAAIQAAEDACAALAAERGGRMALRFPAGTYAIGDTVLKRAGVDWRMAGELRRADADAAAPGGVQYALVLADAVDGWSVDGGVFRAVTHRKVEAAGLPRKNGNSDPGNTNACIHVTGCVGWSVRNATFRDYSQGVIYQGCAAFRIEGNEMEDGSGETIASMLDGSYDPGYGYSGTGAIIHGTIASGPPPVSSNFAIRGNVIRNPGLDIAIGALSQAYDAQPGVVAGNVVFGSRAGVQVYRGSYPDPGDAPTYEARLLIEGNYLYGLWEQGIYLRGVTGVRCAGNVIHFAGQVGSNGAGSSAGGIVTRVNPFNPALGWASQGALSDRSGIEIEGNLVQNCGRPGTSSDGAIQVRVPNTRVRGNRVVRDEKLFTAREGVAITAGGGEMTGPFAVEDNEIVNFAVGVREGNILGTAPDYGVVDIRGNRISMVDVGVEIDGQSPTPRRIEGNAISEFGEGVALRNAPFAAVERNLFSKGDVGVRIRSGCLASDVVAQVTGGAKSGGSIRRGGTVTVRGNSFRAVAAPHVTSETSSADAKFHGRCAVWEGDVADGAAIDGSVFSGATPPTGFTARTWRVGDRARNETIASGVVYERICTSPGSNGGTGATTGATVAGSAVVSEVADWSGIGPGMYLSVGGTPALVVSIDPDADSFTTDFTFGATASGVAIDKATPVFADLYVAA